MIEELKLEFPEFITHIPINRKDFVKIGYNKIYTGVHFSQRSSLVAAMHGFIEKFIPEDIKMQGPVETSLIIYAPINYGVMKLITDKETGRKKINWKPAAEGYKPNWDLGNLALMWLKCLDDVVIKKGIIPDDTIEHIQKTSYEFIPVNNLSERKLVYKLKTIE